MSGVIAAYRDRSGRWLAFQYDAAGRVTEIHAGDDLSAPLDLRYTYDEAGNLTMAANEEAAVEFSTFDLLGRPGITRTYRYLNHSGLLESPALGDVHTQQHVWSIYDNERTRWRMPAAGVVAPADDELLPSQWLTWIDESHDAAGNLTQQRSAADATSAAAGPVLSQSVMRGIGRPTQRSRTTGGQSLTTAYNYADRLQQNGDVDPNSGFGFADGSLAQTVSSIGSALLAGSRVMKNQMGKVTFFENLGLSQRASRFEYDKRGRVQGSVLDGLSDSPQQAITESYSPSDVRTSRAVSPLLDPAQRQLLGGDASQVEPQSWTATENPGHQIATRTMLVDGNAAGQRAYTFTGGRETANGVWTFTYDREGRTIAKESTSLGRRIEYDYDPFGHLVGRTAFQKSADGAWNLEDRTNVLARDGLPAANTFVWDPVADRLVSIFEAGASTAPGHLPESGLIRQYLHGDAAPNDPQRVLVRLSGGTVVKRYLPIVDEAATGSVTAIVDADTGELAERLLYADAYGDAPRYVEGAVVDGVGLEAKKTATGDLDRLFVRLHLSERVKPETVPHGVSLAVLDADGSVLQNSGASLTLKSDTNTLEWELSPADWSALANTPGAAALEVAVTPDLRFDGWGNKPVMPPPEWAKAVYGVESLPDAPFIAKESIDSINDLIAQAGTTTAKSNIYRLPSLYLAASDQSSTGILTDFKAAPFREPADGMIFVNDGTWYDSETGTATTPDGIGTSSQYEIFAGDPVNHQPRTFGEAALHAGASELGNLAIAYTAFSAAQMLPVVGRFVPLVGFGLWIGSEVSGAINGAASIIDEFADEGIYDRKFEASVVGVTRSFGITDLIEAETGQDIVTGRRLDEEERGERFGSGTVRQVVNLATLGYARTKIDKSNVIKNGSGRAALAREPGGTGQLYDKANGQGLYVLVDPETAEMQVKYVGRGDAPARVAKHALDPNKAHLEAKILFQNTLSKAEAKGLEQRIIDEFGGAESVNRYTNLMNKIRSYSPLNPNADKYKESVTRELWEETLRRIHGR